MQLSGRMRRPTSRAQRVAIAGMPVLLAWLIVPLSGGRTAAQTAPIVFDNNLGVRTIVSGLEQPASMAFLGTNDFLITEKAAGRVKHVVNGAVTGTAIDLAVNNSSERGLLGIALHPNFATTHWVYLYWTCRTAAAATPDTPQPDCPPVPQTGADSGNLLETALLGNRVDRFVWNGSSLTFDRNIIKLHAFQFDATNGVARGNHNGGVIRFGPDGKLYIVIGDNGRRGQLQNLVDGPFGPGIPDDQFGGPAPDDEHFTGVIIRLNDDGSTPTDNPFFAAGAAIGGEVGANVQMLFAYGLRNSFGMAFDPVSGKLWEQENGDDSFSELNLAEPGFNSGWVQIMGPPERIGQFKAIETDPTAPQPFAPSGYFGLQQVRWSPTNIADTPDQALDRLFMLPGAHYSAPELSWKFEVAPGGIGFLSSRALGPQYANDLFVGAARTFLEGGHVFRLNLTGNRTRIGVDDPRLEDRVADNVNKWEITESETLLFGRNFGIVTDVQTGPNGNLFLVSLTSGVVYEVFRP
jgi:aldose sugar dehydrogenase